MFVDMKKWPKWPWTGTTTTDTTDTTTTGWGTTTWTWPWQQQKEEPKYWETTPPAELYCDQCQEKYTKNMLDHITEMGWGSIVLLDDRGEHDLCICPKCYNHIIPFNQAIHILKSPTYSMSTMSTTWSTTSGTPATNTNTTWTGQYSSTSRTTTNTP